MARSLHKKTSVNVNFGWNEEMQRAFEEIKIALYNPPVLAYPEFSKAFLVSTDASNKAI